MFIMLKIRNLFTRRMTKYEETIEKCRTMLSDLQDRKLELTEFEVDRYMTYYDEKLSWLLNMSDEEIKMYG